MLTRPCAPRPGGSDQRETGRPLCQNHAFRTPPAHGGSLQMNPPLKIGLMGYGFAGQTFHAPVIA